VIAGGESDRLQAAKSETWCRRTRRSAKMAGADSGNADLSYATWTARTDDGELRARATTVPP